MDLAIQEYIKKKNEKKREKCFKKVFVNYSPRVSKKFRENECTIKYNI